MYYPGLSREAGRPMYDQQRPQSFQIDHKIAEHYPTLRTASSQQSHVIHPGSGLTINPAQAPPKGKNTQLYCDCIIAQNMNLACHIRSIMIYCKYEEH